MATVTMTLEEYQALLAGIMELGMDPVGANMRAMEIARAERAKEVVTETRKRGSTKYQRAYKKAFRNVKSKYLKKNGQWKQGGFKAAVREAHRIAKRAVK